MATQAADLGWQSRWQAVRPSAQYHPTFGLEGAWRQHADDWGYPLEDAESEIEHNGQTLKGRTFSRVGVVVWNPSSGAEVVGWPS
jgi:hypothetical protein